MASRTTAAASPNPSCWTSRSDAAATPGAGSNQEPDDLGVQCRASGGDPGERVHELADIGDAIFEQIADSGRVASEELGGVAGLDLLGEDQDPDLGVAPVSREP